MKKSKKILDLRPTQFAVGMLEIDEKMKEVKKYNKTKFREWLSIEVPVVVSPKGELFVTDHHHFLCICYYLGINKVRIKITRDYSNSRMSYNLFWKRMQKLRSIYLYCQFGEGPREALYLPKDIRGLADDPYRSLAWYVRKAGAFENSEKNFAEFQWANFFRSHKLLGKSGKWGLARALVKAAQLAQSPQAKRLPGYGKLNINETPEAKGKKLKKKILQQIKKRKVLKKTIEVETSKTLKDLSLQSL